jgi:hypothetical protein
MPSKRGSYHKSSSPKRKTTGNILNNQMSVGI